MKVLINQLKGKAPILSIAMLLMLTTGCSTFSKKPAIPEEGLTMPELYHKSINEQYAAVGSSQENQDIITALKRDDGSMRPSYVGYTREANNEINSLFKPLPNPSVPIYIYPHLTHLGDDTIPVPGYTSTFFLYKQNRYATIAENY